MTPLRKIQIVAVVLAIYGIYNVWMVAKYGQPLFLLWTATCLLASAGLWMKKPWSRFVVYAVCSLTILGLLFFVGAMALNGWPYPGLAKTVVALIPGVLVVALCVWFIVVSFRFFRAAKAQT
jgi:hypothetical protein